MIKYSPLVDHRLPLETNEAMAKRAKNLPPANLTLLGRKPRHWSRLPTGEDGKTNPYTLHMLLLKPDGRNFTKKYVP
jgi:hypothetical protein